MHLLRMVEWWMSAMEENTTSLGVHTLTRSQAMLMAHINLGEHRPIRLAEKIGISRQAVHFIINQLVELDMIEVRPDPEDGRANIVEVAAEHRGSANAYEQIMAVLESRLVERFGAEDFATFAKIASSDWGDYPVVSPSDLDAVDGIAPD